ncbi:MAG: 5'-methylthioadenosine/adenosylhomocysteine nucleosidase [Polaromonas sp.]|nr:5'-methylthioadenosine/adenosylhomocysteine nucleosidase [Polaromonas sp.]
MSSPAPLASPSTIAILSALAEEQHGLIDLLEGPVCTRHAGRDFWRGKLHGQAVVLALTRIGKVAAATTTTALIEQFGVNRVVFTGVAGALGKDVNMGDVVVATAFLQHDLDASPLFPRFEVPLYGRTLFDSDAQLTALLCRAAADAVRDRAQFLPHADAFPAARMHLGLVATGDAFISEASESAALQVTLRAAGFDALAVEMEGAAVAQVCHDYGVPFAAVRTISDRADDTAHVDFPAFVADVASRYARVIVERFLLALSKQ